MRAAILLGVLGAWAPYWPESPPVGLGHRLETIQEAVSKAGVPGRSVLLAAAKCRVQVPARASRRLSPCWSPSGRGELVGRAVRAMGHGPPRPALGQGGSSACRRPDGLHLGPCGPGFLWSSPRRGLASDRSGVALREKAAFMIRTFVSETLSTQIIGHKFSPEIRVIGFYGAVKSVFAGSGVVSPAVYSTVLSILP